LVHLLRRRKTGKTNCQRSKHRLWSLKEVAEKKNKAPTLPWDMSYEECKKISDAKVKENFKRKEPEKKDKVVKPSDLKFFIGMCKANKKKNHYARSAFGLQPLNYQVFREENIRVIVQCSTPRSPKEAINRAARNATDRTTRLNSLFANIEAHDS